MAETTGGGWLPTTVKEMERLGWDRPDVVLVSGDAYIDHPSSGTAMIARVLERAGARVAVVPQPNWQDDLRDFRKFGQPRLFFGVNAGAMDSMVNHYTAHKRRRSDDAYSPGGQAGLRPDYAATFYCRALRRFFPGAVIIAGGIEASQRRFAHYDYWQDRLAEPFLAAAPADFLVYGMGEEAMGNIARHLLAGGSAADIRRMPQVAYLADPRQAAAPYDPLPGIGGAAPAETLALHPYEACLADRRKHAENFRRIETESNKLKAKRITQEAGGKVVVVNPPYPPPTTQQMDSYYALPFRRAPHPKYDKRGPIPAFAMIRDSVTIHRGCFGGCSFCAISAHQGKFVSSRSAASVVAEVGAVAAAPGFKGNVSDLGGPSANMYRMGGRDAALCSRCAKSSCLHPRPCPNLRVDHRPLLDLYRQCQAVAGVRRVYIGSGIRYDMLFGPDGELTADGRAYAREVITRHVSGRLKVAPEHTQDHVLALMRKPPYALFERFRDHFARACREAGLNQQLVPYFISSHPGCQIPDMAALHRRTRGHGVVTEQIQDFTPTPMTLATTIYCTGVDPYTGREVPTARDIDEKRLQKSFFFAHDPRKMAEITQRLRAARRHDLLAQLAAARRPKDNRR